MGQAFDPPAVRKERLGESRGDPPRAPRRPSRVLRRDPLPPRRGTHWRPCRSTCPCSSASTAGRPSPMPSATPTSSLPPCSAGRGRTGSTTTCAGRPRGSTTPSRGCARAAAARWDGDRAARAGAGRRRRPTTVTGAANAIAGRIGMDAADALSTPFLCLGTHAEIARAPPGLSGTLGLQLLQRPRRGGVRSGHPTVARGGPRRVRRRSGSGMVRSGHGSGQDTVLVRTRLSGTACRHRRPCSGPGLEQVLVPGQAPRPGPPGCARAAGARRRRGSRWRRRRCPGSSGPR